MVCNKQELHGEYIQAGLIPQAVKSCQSFVSGLLFVTGGGKDISEVLLGCPAGQILCPVSAIPQLRASFWTL